jgi:hypothetical protein
MKAGDTVAKQNPNLRIIDDDEFERAQKLMRQRTNEYKESRNVPLNMKGRSLLSGNIYCGHCGSRLTLTSNRKTYVRLDGERTKQLRFRYVCFGKTRHRSLCSGQTGYTMSKIDSVVEAILKDIFDRMKRTPESEVIEHCNEKLLADISARLKAAKTDYAKSSREMEALQGEMLNVVMGQSELPRDILSKMLSDAQERTDTAKALVETLQQELEERTANLTQLKKQYSKLLNWSQIFDTAEISVKKMIATYMIERVEVFRGYKMKITLSMDIRQFMEGLDVDTEIVKEKDPTKTEAESDSSDVEEDVR